MTLHEAMVEQGASVLADGLHQRSAVSGAESHGEKRLMQVCRQVQREWLRGEIAFPLFEDLLREVVRRLSL